MKPIAFVTVIALLATACDSPSEPRPVENVHLIAATKLRSVDAATVTQLAAAAGGLGRAFEISNDAEMYAIRYHTTGVDGLPTVASGAVWLPMKVGGAVPTVAYMHGTSTPRDNVPSNPTNTEGTAVGALYGTSGFMAVLPDYIGMGSGTGFHPWQHAATEAFAATDMLKAARELAAEKKVALSGGLFILGYSQGGHAAMAVHRELELHPIAGFRIVGSAPMAGAYDVTGSARRVLQRDTAYAPTVFYSLYLGVVYNAIYGVGPKLSDIFVPYYDALGEDVLAGTTPAIGLSRLLPERPRMIFQPDFLQAIETDPNHAFWRATAENDVYDWRPRAPLRLFHASGDGDVSIANAITAAARMQALGADVRIVDLGANLDHTAAFVPALRESKLWFDTLR